MPLIHPSLVLQHHHWAELIRELDDGQHPQMICHYIHYLGWDERENTLDAAMHVCNVRNPQAVEWQLVVREP